MYVAQSTSDDKPLPVIDFIEMHHRQVRHVDGWYHAMQRHVGGVFYPNYHLQKQNLTYRTF